MLGLNVSPRNRLRVRSRGPKEATDTILAAEAAGLKAKEIRQASKDRLSYRDLDSFETSLIPVRIKKIIILKWHYDVCYCCTLFKKHSMFPGLVFSQTLSCPAKKTSMLS